ncbi:MAG: carboxypeptidase-like regulatory domain-containing protein, partial [Bacteroidales bacterium]|nr:carboxypeptidase-like regulatory domain-containing protein [Bacteroidales bacterium]
MAKLLLSKQLLFLAIICFCSITIFAQKGEVTGTVTDANDGTTLPGATIVIKGTIQGAITDIDGKYTIDVEPNQVLVFSYVGFTSQELIVQPNTTVNVALQSSALSLEGVVVIGYGTVKK